jgi:elongation factor Tu
MRRVVGWTALAALLAVARLGEAGKEKFSLSKPHVNVAALGDSVPGEATLAAAIVRVQGDAGYATSPSAAPLRHAPLDGPGGLAAICEAEYETAGRRYAHVDCPGHADYVKNMITGAAQMDGAILVVSATDGPMPKTREHVLLARQLGVPSIVVFMNKCDQVEDPDLLDLVEREVRELLRAHDFPGDTVPVVRGSALKAAQGDPVFGERIRVLLDEMDRCIPLPVPERDRPFLMPVEDVFQIRGRGTVVTGRVERGTVLPGDPVEVVGLGPVMPDQVVAFERVPSSLLQAGPGDRLGLVLETGSESGLQRGAVLAAPGSIRPWQHFEAEVYVLEKEEGGRHTPFHNGYRPQFLLRTADVTGEIVLPEGREFVMPGDHATVTVRLVVPVAVEQHLRFEIRDAARPVGVGVVTRTLP